MRRNTQNLVIDAATLLVMLGMLATGLLLRFVLPLGSGRQALTLWGWDRHDWGDTHSWLAVSLLGMLALHLAMHWSWVCATVSHRVLHRAADRPQLSIRHRTAIGAGFLAVVAIAVGVFLMIAFQSTTSFHSGERRGQGPPVMMELHASDFWGHH